MGDNSNSVSAAASLAAAARATRCMASSGRHAASALRRYHINIIYRAIAALAAPHRCISGRKAASHGK